MPGSSGPVAVGRSARKGASDSPCRGEDSLLVTARDATQRRAGAIMRPVDLSLHGSTEPLAQRYDVALVDLDGVVYVGPEAVPRPAACPVDR